MKTKRAISFLMSAMLLLSMGAYAGAQEASVSTSRPILEARIDTTKQKAELKTFDQIVKEISIAADRDVQDIRNELIENKTSELKRNSPSFFFQKSNTELRQIAVKALAAQQYTTYSYDSFPVLSKGSLKYQPKQILFYCAVTPQAGQEWRLSINRVEHIVFDRSNAYTGSGATSAKQFSGTTYVKLENDRNIYFSLDGDFYDYGTTTYSGNLGINIGQYATIGFSISNSSNWFQFMYHPGRYTVYW